MKDYLPYLASISSGLIVFLLGNLISQSEKREKADSSVEIKVLDDRAKLTQELWDEVRANRTEISKLTQQLSEEKLNYIKLESKYERLLIKYEELQNKIEELEEKLGASDGQNKNS